MNLKTLTALIVVAGLIAGGLFTVKKIKHRLDSITIENVNFSKVKNGSYEGYCDAIAVTAKVEITMKNGRIERFFLKEHRHGKGYGADTLASIIAHKNSLVVDNVTGATYSSKVMKKAVELALKKGL